MTYQKNATPEPMAKGFFIGGRYNWKYQSERLIYLGHNWSGNGYWHQFAKVESPEKVWCEVLASDLDSFEETQAEQNWCDTSVIERVRPDNDWSD